MMDKSIWRAAAAACTAVLVAACGGGDSVAGIDGTGITPPSPEPGQTVAVGTITAFGSVYVNGVHFDTSSTSFTINGQSGTQSDLSVGDVVVVVGSLSANDPTQGTAQRITFDGAVEGPIGAIDTAANTLVVLGQSVAITADTSFDSSIQPPSLDGLTVGDIVQVSGFRTSSGALSATRIASKPASLDFETTGIVANLDSAAFTFTINGLSVDYGTAMLVNFPSGRIRAGDLVEVNGASLGASGELIATRVELKSDDLPGEAGDHVEIEGFITRFVDANDFDVAGARVTTTNQTGYEGGTAADLGLDVKVEAEGELDGNGVLVASKIDIRRAHAVRVAALVDAVDAAAGSFEILGITVKVDALTRIEDKTSQQVQPFSVANLVAGDYVEVRGAEFPAGSGEIAAGLVERDELDSDTELQGFVSAVNGTDLTILGVTIVTAAASFRDADETPISSATFFSRVQAGSLVEVTGTESGVALINASLVELENVN